MHRLQSYILEAFELFFLQVITQKEQQLPQCSFPERYVQSAQRKLQHHRRLYNDKAAPSSVVCKAKHQSTGGASTFAKLQQVLTEIRDLLQIVVRTHTLRRVADDTAKRTP